MQPVADNLTQANITLTDNVIESIHLLIGQLINKKSGPCRFFPSPYFSLLFFWFSAAAKKYAYFGRKVIVVSPGSIVLH